MILIVVNAQLAVLKSQQAILEKEIPLHQLHRVVGLIAARLVVLQHAQNPAGINAAQLRVRVVTLLVQALRPRTAKPDRLSSLPARPRHPAKPDRDRGRLWFDRHRDSGRPHARACDRNYRPEVSSLAPAPRRPPPRACRDVRSKIFWFAHDVRAQKNCAAVATRQVSLVRQNRRRVPAAGLAKISDHVINADRNVFANFLVTVVRQRVFERLQAFHRLPQRRRFLLACQLTD